MSSTEARRERMQRILKLLAQNPSGLNPHEIARKTEIITEITMDRLHKYLAELVWSDLIFCVNGKYMLLGNAPVENKRKRERETNKERETEDVKKQ
jgi:hypothetical protein